LELLRWQQILEVRGIPRDEHVASGKYLRRDQDISVTLPGARLLLQAPDESQRQFVKVQEVKLPQQCLRLLPYILHSGKLRGLCFEERIGSVSELFRRKHDVLGGTFARLSNRSGGSSR
jgi:hypothetical protein